MPGTLSQPLIPPKESPRSEIMWFNPVSVRVKTSLQPALFLRAGGCTCSGQIRTVSQWRGGDHLENPPHFACPGALPCSKVFLLSIYLEGLPRLDYPKGPKNLITVLWHMRRRG